MMKKFLLLCLTLMLPITAIWADKTAYESASNWQNFKNIAEAGWAATNTESIPAGTKIELEDITMTFGEEGSPEFTVVEDPMPDYETIFRYLICGNGVNGNKAGGTYYLFKPKKNGKLTVIVRQNVVKKFYVEESGCVMDDFNSLLPETKGSKVYYGTYTIPVIANLTYKVYCAGSKLCYYGFVFESSSEVRNISFADEKVKALCIANWDTNGDGELSVTEAAAVTTLGNVFKENKEITSFDELRFFTGLTELTGRCFTNCENLKSIAIPSGVSSIAGFAFSNCSSLEQICVDPSNTVFDSRLQCDAIIETATNKLVVGCQSTDIPETVSAIGTSAFWGRWGMSVIKIPEQVSSIEPTAFAYCVSLEKITMPKGLTEIGESAFWGCDNLKEVRVENPVPAKLVNDKTFSNRANAKLCVPAGTKVAYEAADYWKDFMKIVETGWTPTSSEDIPAGTKIELEDITMTIGKAGSPYFTVDPWNGYDETFNKRIVGNNVNGDNENGTFYLFNPKKNGDLTVVVKQSVTKKFYVEQSGKIMDEFNGITAESDDGSYRGTYTIPVFANLTYKIYCAGSKMGFYGFSFAGRDDADWTNIEFADEKVKQLCVANWDTNGDGELSISEAAAVTSLGEVFKDNKEITSFDELCFFTGLKSIDGWVTFRYCEALKSITIPSGVTHVDGAAFAGCVNLEQICVDPANTVYDSRNACNSIIETATNKLVVGNNNGVIIDDVTVVGADAFHGRPGIKWIGIPESVTELESGAFAWCGNLSGVVLPAELKTIGESAFAGCGSLTWVETLNPVPLALKNVETFSERANATLCVPNKSIASYKEADIWKEFKSIIGLYRNQIYSDAVTAYVGYSSEMVINLENEEAYTAYQFDLVLPEGITLEKDEDGKFIITKGDRYPSSRSITITPHDGNMYRIVSASLKNEEISGYSGALLTISLLADEAMEKKKYTAEIKNIVLTKSDESQLNAEPSTIPITIKEVLWGDSNNDGYLNVTDAVASINNILGRPSKSFNMVQADINKDKLVDIFDVILDLNLIRNHNTRSMKMNTRGEAASESNLPKLSIDDFSISSTEPQQLQIELENEDEYVGFQFDLILPEGIKLKGYSVNTSRVPEDIEVDMEQKEGVYRFIGAGLGMESIKGTSGSIIRITVEADEDLKGRNLMGSLKDIKLSKLNGSGTTKEEATFNITNLSSGDLNINGTLDSGDISEMVNLIMEGTYKAKADINGDGKVDAADLVLLIKEVN